MKVVKIRSTIRSNTTMVVEVMVAEETAGTAGISTWWSFTFLLAHECQG